MKTQFALAAAIFIGCHWLQAIAQNYSIDWYKIADGGGTSAGGPYSVSGTIGQHDAGGQMVGANYSLTGGFWSLIAAVPAPGLPSLTISQSANTVTISWPATGSYILLQNANLATGNWTTNTAPVSMANGTNSITISPPVGNLFFRLKQ
jgi:hypothetical protein